MAREGGRDRPGTGYKAAKRKVIELGNCAPVSNCRWRENSFLQKEKSLVSRTRNCFFFSFNFMALETTNSLRSENTTYLLTFKEVGSAMMSGGMSRWRRMVDGRCLDNFFLGG